MSESLTDNELAKQQELLRQQELERQRERIKEAQQKAVEEQQQREMQRQEQTEKNRDEAAKAETIRLNEAMTEMERAALDDYVKNFEVRLKLDMASHRQKPAPTLSLDNMAPYSPAFKKVTESELLNNSINRLQVVQYNYVKELTEDLQKEWNAVTQKALEQQAEKDRLQAEQDKLKEQGLEKMAAQAVKQERGHNPYETLKQEQAQQKDDLLKKAAADLLKETTPPRVITEAEYLADIDNARQKWREQQEAQQIKDKKCNAALDRMLTDRVAGKEINHNDLSHLNHADLQSIKDRGEAALQELIRQRQQELEKQLERERIKREFQQNGREITRHS